MVTIYVIEILIEDDVVTTHIFLTLSKAFNAIGDIIRDHDSAKRIHLIKKEINDDTGITNDEIVHTVDLTNILEEKDKD